MAVLVRWDPWQMATELARDAERLLRQDLGPWKGTPGRWVLPLSEEGGWVPACDLFARAGDLAVRLELPGIDPAKDVQISVQDGVLCVRGERKFDDAPEHAGYYRRETRYGAFERGIKLPEGVMIDDITASYDKGVLEIVLAKAARLPEPTRIPIRAGNGTKEVAAGATAS